MNRIEQACHDRGMRMTEQRRIIAQVIAESEDHPDVEELYRRTSAVDGSQRRPQPFQTDAIAAPFITQQVTQSAGPRRSTVGCPAVRQ